jgi:hypothetical protein
MVGRAGIYIFFPKFSLLCSAYAQLCPIMPNYAKSDASIFWLALAHGVLPRHDPLPVAHVAAQVILAPGQAVQVDPIKPMLKAPGTERLKL